MKTSSSSFNDSKALKCPSLLSNVPETQQMEKHCSWGISSHFYQKADVNGLSSVSSIDINFCWAG